MKPSLRLAIFILIFFLGGGFFAAADGQSTKVTGILSDPNFRTALHALEQRTGAGNLAEPQVTTTSGRARNALGHDVIAGIEEKMVWVESNPVTHPFIGADSAGNKVSVVSTNGAVQWSFDCKHPQDCWRLADGNYLFCHEGGALVMSPDNKTVWEYKAGTNTQIHACQPLPDGRVLVVENGPCRILEIDRGGKIVKEVKLTPPPASVKLHDQFRGTRKTLAGHYLVSRKGEHRIEELDGEGKTLRSIPVPGDVHETVLLPNGHLLIACGEGHKVIELDADGKVVWSVDENEIPGHTLRLVSGLQRLPNGNTVICNYLGHGHLGEQAHVFELTPDKKVVWEAADHKNFKVINQIQLLDVPGDPAKGEICR